MSKETLNQFYFTVDEMFVIHTLVKESMETVRTIRHPEVLAIHKNIFNKFDKRLFKEGEN